jgi:hypothetical protein
MAESRREYVAAHLEQSSKLTGVEHICVEPAIRFIVVTCSAAIETAG